MRAKPVTQVAAKPDESGLTTLATLATASFEVVERDLRARIATLEAQEQRHLTAIEDISAGVCFFDGAERLTLSNRRFAEIYRLAPDRIQPGATLREIVELRVAAGTRATAADDYLSFCMAENSRKEAKVQVDELGDGRTIQIRHHPMRDGGWVSTHEDITEFKAARAAADELLSLQALIDRLPDNLWVKDVKSRFVIANKATATRMGFAAAGDLIGKTDLELLSAEIAEQVLRRRAADRPLRAANGRHGGMRIRRLGRQDLDHDDESPLRNGSGEIFGVAGVSRDITERRLADALRDGQALILEMIAMSAPLVDVLDRLVLLTESQFTGIFGSVLLVDETGIG